MSEREDDKRYAAWWEPPLVLLLIVLVASSYNACHGSQLRDLQRRVAQLDSGAGKCK